MKSHFLPKVSVLAAAVALALPAFAAVDGIASSSNNARNQAMQSSYFTLKDDFNIWANPAYVNEYAGRAYVNHTEMAGANVKVGPGVLGAYIGRNYSGDLVNGGVQNGANLLALPATLNNRFDVLYGMNLGAMKVGARLNWNSYSEKVSDSSTSISQEIAARDINLSAGIEMKDLPLDVALTIGLPSLTDTYSNPGAAAGATKTEALSVDDASSLGLVGRFTALKGRDSEIMLSGAYLSHDGSNKLTSTTGGGATTTSTAKPTDTIISLLATYGYTGNNNAYFGITTGLARVTIKTETVGVAFVPKIVTTTIPVRANYEMKQLGESQKWGLRGSLGWAIYNSVNDQTASATSSTVTNDPGAVSWGIGVGYAAMKNLTIDASMDQGYLFEGTALLSGGKNPYSPLIGRLTVNYTM